MNRNLYMDYVKYCCKGCGTELFIEENSFSCPGCGNSYDLDEAKNLEVDTFWEDSQREITERNERWLLNNILESSYKDNESILYICTDMRRVNQLSKMAREKLRIINRPYILNVSKMELKMPKRKPNWFWNIVFKIGKKCFYEFKCDIRINFIASTDPMFRNKLKGRYWTDVLYDGNLDLQNINPDEIEGRIKK